MAFDLNFARVWKLPSPRPPTPSNVHYMTNQNITVPFFQQMPIPESIEMQGKKQWKTGEVIKDRVMAIEIRISRTRSIS